MLQHLGLILILSFLVHFILYSTAQLNNVNNVNSGNNVLNGPDFDVKNAESLYKAFIRRYHRKFRDDDDYYRRYLNFVDTLRTVNKVNKGQPNEKVGPNQFADWTDKERKERMDKLSKPRAIDPDLKALEESKKIIRSTDLVFPGSDAYPKLMKSKNLPQQVSNYRIFRRAVH